MRRFFALGTVAFFLAGVLPLTAQAQTLGQGMDIKPGVRAGVDFMTLSGEGVSDELGWRTGFMLGGFALLDLEGPIAIQPELMYVQKGSSQEETIGETTITSTTKLGYIEVPVLVRLQVPLESEISPAMFLGPTLGINVAAETETEGGGASASQDISDQVNGTDFGLALGGALDVDIPSGTLMVDVRYGLGLTDVAENGSTVNNRGFMITAGFAF